MTRIDAAGLSIDCVEPCSPYAGVRIQFHPGIPMYMRGMALESALRHWQKEVGSVRRGGRADLATGHLPGWRLKKDGKPVRELRLAYKEDTITR